MRGVRSERGWMSEEGGGVRGVRSEREQEGGEEWE